MPTTPEEFTRGAFQWLSVNAAHQRSTTWVKGADNDAKGEAKKYLYRRLAELAEGYIGGGVEDGLHETNIAQLAKDVKKHHGGVLHDGRYRIGSAQKALNLYLKYLWCAGRIAEPPHCPFDSQVITAMVDHRLRTDPPVDIPAKWRAWTKVDELEAYRRWVREARKVAGDISLPMWELGVWRPT